MNSMLKTLIDTTSKQLDKVSKSVAASSGLLMNFLAKMSLYSPEKCRRFNKGNETHLKE